MNKRILGIDLIKDMAIIGVILLHVTSKAFILDNQTWNTTIKNIPLQFLYYAGTFSIPIFFLVNGYLILGKKEVKFKYCIKKILSMILVAFFWNFLYAIIKFFSNGKVLNPLYSTIGSFVQRGFFYQFWFFGTLIILFLIVPILSYLLRKNEKVYIIIIISLTVVCCSFDLLNHVHLFNGDIPIQKNVVQTFRLWTWLMYYMVGGLFSKKEKLIYESNHLFNGRIIALISIATVFFLVINKSFIGSPYTEYNYDNPIVIINVILLFCILKNIKINQNILKKIVVNFSTCTMGVFIIHIPILLVISKFLDMRSPLLNLLGIFLTLFLSFFITAILIKIPVIKKIVKL